MYCTVYICADNDDADRRCGVGSVARSGRGLSRGVRVSSARAGGRVGVQCLFGGDMRAHTAVSHMPVSRVQSNGASFVLQHRVQSDADAACGQCVQTEEEEAQGPVQCWQEHQEDCVIVLYSV